MQATYIRQNNKKPEVHLCAQKQVKKITLKHLRTSGKFTFKQIKLKTILPLQINVKVYLP